MNTQKVQLLQRSILFHLNISLSKPQRLVFHSPSNDHLNCAKNVKKLPSATQEKMWKKQTPDPGSAQVAATHACPQGLYVLLSTSMFTSRRLNRITFSFAIQAKNKCGCSRSSQETVGLISEEASSVLQQKPCIQMTTTMMMKNLFCLSVEKCCICQVSNLIMSEL